MNGQQENGHLSQVNTTVPLISCSRSPQVVSSKVQRTIYETTCFQTEEYMEPLMNGWLVVWMGSP